ncbi:MAG: class I SAM-dependent methyltransferase [Pirellulales bacterium]|nr:class I SAM-dependent methyltransferase [Pirellulales bacterium]
MSRSRRFLAASLWLSTGVLALPGNCQETKTVKSSVPPALEFYEGRRIAVTMHYAGAEWLIRNEREREERCSLMLENLGVEKGMTICDMGCGNGFYALKLAEMVGPEGRILGVDIQPEMLSLLRERMEEKRISNVTPILGSFHNPRLPDGGVDLILLVDVYHEFSHPEHMLRAMRRSLSEDGLIVLVEYREEDPDVPIKPLHKMSKTQIMKELTRNHFVFAREFNGLPWQHMMFFGRDDAKGDLKSGAKHNAKDGEKRSAQGGVRSESLGDLEPLESVN